ncbi:MAG: UDP-3-O-(3-hydroxymyristoyl)glucosamine N-acyltransferase [Acidobacteria bacterium]|nr:UDP-3-O-(3-hydroxymyristoyl)glucosamine N-acyltransferase [Acidobacteriota bacterium]
MLVRELAEWLGATFEGDGEKDIAGVAAVETAGAADLSFVAGRKAARAAQASAAGCLIVPADFANPGRTVVRAGDPRLAFARAVARLTPRQPDEPGVHPRACVHETAKLGAGVRIGAGCVVGRRVAIGADSLLHANVTVYDDCEIGQRAILHSGCVIGADGFGFVLVGGRYEKFPQVGRVVIGDDVEIGANSCVDRAALGVTWIGDGAKLDNLVHVAHNCRIGRHVVVAAQTGFSGGVVVEDGAVVGGQVGVGDKARIESGAVIGSGSGILSSKVVHGGQVVWGTPARPLKEHLEQLASLARLPSLRREFAELKQRLERMEDAAGRRR